jgi:lysophospholipase L1-like esterase
MKKTIAVLFLFILIFVFAISCKKQSNPSGPETLTPTPVVAAADNSTYSFEDGTIMGWSIYQNITLSANSIDRAYLGSHSLRIDGGFASANNLISVAPVGHANINGKIVQAKIWVPSNFTSAYAEIFVQSSENGWPWLNGPYTALVPGSWTTLTFEPLHPAYTSVTFTVDVTNLIRLGIKFVPASACNGSIYLDSVNISDFGTPTATFTASPTPTTTRTPGGPTDTFTLTSTITPTFTITPDITYLNGLPSDSTIQYYGRWNKTNALQPSTGWGTSYIIAGFSGTDIAIKLSAWDVWFEYAIDDFSNPDNFTKFEINNEMYSFQPTPVIISNLSNTTHKIMIVRRSEGAGGISRFLGFGLDQSALLSTPPDPVPSKKMEFIGDSITCGSQDEWTSTASCSDPYWGCVQDGYKAFGPQLARLYGAEGRTISRGGIGVYVNCSGCTPPPVMKDVYELLAFEQAPTGTSVKYDFTQWQADVVVIAIGTNDFSYLLNTSPDPTVFKNGFEAAYENLISIVRGHYPNAYILCTDPVPSLWVPAAAGTYIGDVVSYENSTMSDALVYHVPLNTITAAGLPLIAAEYAMNQNTHPLEAGHTKIANALKMWIDANILAGLQANHGW